ncbi:MAG TPA: hypothetical protein VI386_13365 [Candidatus Sulfotelmatobacter sp.]
MRKLTIAVFVIALLLLFSLAWSPRDFLTRRLAADLIARSNAFKTPQQFWMRTGILSNSEYLSAEYLALQRKGWISATSAPCPPNMAQPCWDVVLSPSGVETIRALVAPSEAEKPAFSVQVAKRDLVAITGVGKQGNFADVEFIWKWTALNELGAALYPNDQHYRSTVEFRDFDDGWRVLQSTPHFGQPLDDALKNSEPAQ